MALKRTEGEEGRGRVNKKKKILKRKRFLMAVVHLRPPRKETKVKASYAFKLDVNESSKHRHSTDE